jgi:hypothetical protein
MAVSGGKAGKLGPPMKMIESERSELHEFSKNSRKSRSENGDFAIGVSRQPFRCARNDQYGWVTCEMSEFDDISIRTGPGGRVRPP